MPSRRIGLSHGVRRIRDQIHDDLLKLTAIRPEMWEVGCNVYPEVDAI